MSDLAWVGEHPYDPKTGEGAVGVELAGTAVSSTGVKGTLAYARQQAQDRVGNATALQWNDGYYRGYFVVSARKDHLDARYYGSPTVAHRQSWELPLANFTVRAGDNRLRRPVDADRVTGLRVGVAGDVGHAAAGPAAPDRAVGHVGVGLVGRQREHVADPAAGGPAPRR